MHKDERERAEKKPHQFAFYHFCIFLSAFDGVGRMSVLIHYFCLNETIWWVINKHSVTDWREIVKQFGYCNMFVVWFTGVRPDNHPCYWPEKQKKLLFVCDLCSYSSSVYFRFYFLRYCNFLVLCIVDEWNGIPNATGARLYRPLNEICLILLKCFV